MRLPEPAALLVEHPAVPVPEIGDGHPTLAPVGEPLAGVRLGRLDRYRIAVQLTAAAALLAEFDLWIGRRGFREAVVIRSHDGVQARLGGYPVSLTRVAARLGGGQAAAETMRRSVIESIAEVAGLRPAAIDVERGEPGLFLSRALARQLADLPRPLDPSTARSLWLLRWDPVPPPEQGATSYWDVPRPALARRLAVSLWAAFRRRGSSALVREAGNARGLPLPVGDGGSGLLILAGEFGPRELAALSRWTRAGGGSAVAIGRFPPGWHPPAPPGVDGEHLGRHLVVAGPDPEASRKAVDQRNGRFDPLDESDRLALTAAARRLFESPAPAGISVGDRGPSDRLEEILRLDPDGLPPAFVALHCGLTLGELEQAAAGLEVITGRARWRLPQPGVMRSGPLHGTVADLYPEEDPRRLLHQALASGDTDNLASWARDRLNGLDGATVRDLLVTADPTALGPRLAALASESCLSVLDLSGARAMCSGAADADRPALEGWIGCLDRRADTWFVDQDTVEAAGADRVAAEIAARQLLLRSRRGDAAAAAAMRSQLRGRLKKLSGPLHRRLEIDLAAIDTPERLRDRGWRREIAGGHPELVGRIMYRCALHLVDSGRPRSAVRMLARLLDEELGPGRCGVIENDLGAASIAAGWSRRAELHQLRALRLLQAAGFRHATRIAVFNLAVADVDQLRVRQAEERLQLLAAGEADSLFVTGEFCRLALAVGDEARFRTLLDEFKTMADVGSPAVGEGLALLQGAAEVLEGRFDEARRHLAAGGLEGRVWTTLVDAMEGREPTTVDDDAWGVAVAARCVEAASTEPAGDPEVGRTGSAAKALAVALAQRVGGSAVSIDPGVRVRAVDALRAAGLHGWAERLCEQGRSDVVAAMARVVEKGSWSDLDRKLAEPLVQSLGVTGLEVRDGRSGDVLWHHGTGGTGTEVRSGSVVLVPLGGEVTDDPAWTLVKGLVAVFAPARPDEADDDDGGDTGFAGASAGARTVRRDLRSLGPSHLPIVILGETGVGKEVAARALHRLSGRRGSFVAVNVNAISSSLLESELFGSVRGAFTGADRSRRGLVMAADGGTLFLDEIGDLDPPLQVKLLRFLESREVRPVGADGVVAVDVRILSATNRDLEARVREGRFRHDLYYRLAMCPLVIPPLRERRDDISLLAERFERDAVRLHGLQPVRWSAEAKAALGRYHWPGNARELQKAVEVAMVRADGGVVRSDHLPIGTSPEGPVKAWDEAQRDFRIAYLTAALRRHGGNRSATARELGISRQALLYHLRQLGLQNPGMA